jgi:hypothetical protein
MDLSSRKKLNRDGFRLQLRQKKRFELEIFSI